MKQQSVAVMVLCMCLFVGLAFADPNGLNVSLTDFAGATTQDNQPDQPEFLTNVGLEVNFVGDGGSGTATWEAVRFTEEGAVFGMNHPDGYQGRNYIRTIEDDYYTVDFTAFITVNRSSQDQVYFGLGAAEYGWNQNPDRGTETTNATDYLEIKEDTDTVECCKMGYVDGWIEELYGDIAMTTGSGVMRLRMDYNAADSTLSFSVDYDYDGTFVLDQEFTTFDVSDSVWQWYNGYPAKIFFGGDGGVNTFSDFEIIYTNAAFNPTPVCGEEKVDYDSPTLSWQASEASSLSGYNVYFDSDESNIQAAASSALVSSAQASESYTAGTLTPETTYYWRVDAMEPNALGGTDIYTGNVWSFTTKGLDPEITSQPQSQIVDEGDTATFTVEHINGTDFQWYVDGVAISGATSSTLTISSVSLTDEGMYYCNVSNSALTEGIDSEAVYLLTKRMLAHWTFDDTLTDEVDGWQGVYADSEGTTADPNYAEDSLSGKSMVFDGSDDYIVTVTDSGEYFDYYTEGYTIAAWIKTTTAGGAFVSKEISSSWTNGWALTVYPGEPVHVLRTVGDVTGPDSVVDGEWHFIVGTYEPAGYDPENPTKKSVKLYVDGFLATESVSTSPVTAGGADIIMGAQVADRNASYTGLLDDFSIWSYPLEASDIIQMYADGLGQSVCAEQPEYDFNDDCVVDIADFAEIAGAWLQSNLVHPSQD